ncbi:MAG: hypothetical protein H6901_03040 [Rhodobacteraceae bacterium]|nr:hypothetical protein [Paracoccaceae bacterium]MCP5341169.1 hypothetical protein [Paracoccaceae bacterium]
MREKTTLARYCREFQFNVARIHTRQVSMVSKSVKPSKTKAADARAERLKAALRANLQRRKAQARTRGAEQSAADTQTKNES